MAGQRLTILGGTALIVALAALAGCGPASGRGSVIFIHPDGTSSATWTAARALYVGPDDQLEWDRLPAIGVYRGHMADSVTATSNGGATTHAYGVKVASDAYGTYGGPGHEPIVDAEGESLSVAHQALAAGLPVGLVQTGTNTEPGTGCFVASVPDRGQHEDIAAQLLASGADVILGGGEKYFLPKGTEGVHGPGVRADGRNLVNEARRAGYAVVRTRRDLMTLPEGTPRVLGLFAEYHTFHDRPEEELADKGLPLYEPNAPTVGEMTEVALRVLSAKGKRFLLVVEEEGTDNFGNNNNAPGMFEAMRRADEAIGVARRYLRNHPKTLILTAADSDGGGMRMVGLRPGNRPEALPERSRNGSPVDGVGGTGTAPYLARPDRKGRRWPFAIVWAAYDDVSGAVLVRGEGLNSHLIRPSTDNTDIAKLMRRTLLGK